LGFGSCFAFLNACLVLIQTLKMFTYFHYLINKTIFPSLQYFTINLHFPIPILFHEKRAQYYKTLRFIFRRQTVNFINILRSPFSYKSASCSFSLLYVTREKLPKRLSYKKGVRKTVMKLTKAQ